MKERLAHIDNAKAIGMLLIIASHVMPTGNVANEAIYVTWSEVLSSFYVPLFFLLSGIFEPSNPDRKKLKSRVFKLLKYCLIFYLFGILADGLVNGHWTLTGFKSQTTIWFLIVLVWITLIVGIFKNFRYRLLLYVLLTLCGMFLSYKHLSILYLGQALLCLPFYLIGYYCKNFLRQKAFNWKLALFAFVGWLLLFVLFYKQQNISLNIVTQNYLTFYWDAILGSFFLIEMCKLIKFDALSYYGRNTIVAMIVQIPIIWIVQRYWVVDDLVAYYGASIVIGVLCGCCIPLFRNRYFDVFK